MWCEVNGNSGILYIPVKGMSVQGEAVNWVSTEAGLNVNVEMFPMVTDEA